VIVFDLTHAYQAFQPPDFIPPWVEKNLMEIFLPLSRAMQKGIIRRGLQLQGWTIEAWFAADDPIRGLALETLTNLKEACQRGNIEIGASGYSHPIFPLLSDEVIKREVVEDLVVVAKFLGKPTWFWFPEGAVDQRSLTTVHEVAPDLAVVVPDGSLGKRQFSGFVRIEFAEGNFQRAIVCNTLLKDIFMNAEDYQSKPPYAPEDLDWDAALQATHSGKDFVALLEALNSSKEIVLVRDLENAGSKYGLAKFEERVKEVKGLVEAKLGFSSEARKGSRPDVASGRIRFTLPGEIDWEAAPTVGIEEVKASSWEPAAKEDDPYPYWAPRHLLQPTAKIIKAWERFVETFNRLYHPDFPKESLITLASDVPWHFLGKKEWHPNPQHSAEFARRVILPIVREIGIPDLTKAAEKLSKTVDDFIKENGA